MKKFLLLVCLIAAGSLTAGAQTFALIDMDYILERIPAYQKAVDQIDSSAEQWQSEVEKLTNEAKTLYEAYQSAASGLTETQRQQKEQAIIDKEKEAAELRQTYFGNEGELAKLQDDLLGPIEDSIYDAVKAVALRDGYAVVVDRASATSIFFANPNIDISDEILKKLGY